MRIAFGIHTSRLLLILAGLCVLTFNVTSFAAEASGDTLLCRPELSAARRAELADKLRGITGWSELHFDASGVMRFGGVTTAAGSPAARSLLKAAAAGNRLMVFEDASGKAEVAFSRVMEGRWRNGGEGAPPVFIVQIDFADYARVKGDRAALAAFNVGWAVLHEIAHAFHDSDDSDTLGEVGECEELINLMRRECGLAERAEYFFTPLPGAWRGEFTSRHVRLAFERRAKRSTKRYWLVWDASLVGGLDRAAR